MSSVAVNSVAETPCPPQSTLRTDTLAKSVVVLLVVTVVQRLIGFGRGVIYCRWLEPSALGEWDLAFGFLMLAAPLAVLGLPGSFGRYVEYYRQRGQLRTFLRRTARWTALLGLTAVVVTVVFQDWFAAQMFGESSLGGLAMWCGLCLGTVIVHHFLESLLMALRLSRVVSGMQFCQSAGFAGLSIVFMLVWSVDARSIVAAYAVASILSAAGSLVWLRAALSDLPTEVSPPPQAEFWARLLPFAGWIWMANLLTNLFGIVDRYMLVHFSGLSPEQALAEVGNYHSSRIVPLLLIGVASLIGSIITPYLSHDWEAGLRDQVAVRLNLAIKLVALLLLTSGVGLLLFAPWLFDVAFAGKYNGGLAVLPWTLTYCTWFGVALIAQNYLWCAERASLCSIALAIGLGLNIVLNLLLLPRYGLLGAVLGTTAANFLALSLICAFNHYAGMRFDRGAWLLILAPAALGLGLLPAAATLTAIMLIVIFTQQVFTSHDKYQLLQTIREKAGVRGEE